MMKAILHFHLLICLMLFLNPVIAYADSGGPLSPAQAAYDVKYYELDLTFNTTNKTISGSVFCRVEIVNAIDTLELDLDDPFTIDSVLITINEGSFSNAVFTHSNGKVNVIIPTPVMENDIIDVVFFYAGKPRISNAPPWDPGFVWKTSPAGKPWIGVACEDEGGDLWWPCKDHPSDEPDSMRMSYTVPDPLICVSNGQYIGNTVNEDGTTSYQWFISTPINNYNVTFYISEFDLIEDDYLSSTGDTIPFFFWVLPESYETAVNYMDVFLEEFNFLEAICGPFPFGTDKHGWAHAPYWGMEHQTIIAYGHNFTTNSWGYDYIHYHELAHEWWGNLITAKDWADVWLHEGIATYTEALYVEHLSGMEAYHQFMDNTRPNDNHSYPLAPYEELTASEAFGNLNPYSRGAAVMHTLRYHLGDADFFNLLERWAYPDSTDYNNTNGRLCRIMTTDDMKNQAEEVTGRELDPFFDVFFREASYPDLHIVRESDSAVFYWETENNVLLDVDVPIVVNGEDWTVDMIDGTGSALVKLNDELVIDPKQWILMAEPTIVVSIEEEIAQAIDVNLNQNYPNPFRYSTTIEYSINERNLVSLKVFDLFGNDITTLVNEEQGEGFYSIHFNREKLSNGIYYYCLQTGDYFEVKRFLVID